MKPLSICILILLPLLTLSAQDEPFFVSGNPIQGIFEAFEEDSADLGPERVVLKIEYDFDSDGEIDIALSNYPNLCGNAGCAWSMYLRRPKGFLYLGQFFFHDGAIYIEPVRSGVSRIVTYRHMSAFEGTLEEYELSSTGIKGISSLPSDTSNWRRLQHISKGQLSPTVVYADDVRQYLKTRRHAWKRWR